ncbi:MAG: HEAT repeat protein [Planctomycetota bacterium]|jgi:HEAT repeat protein
MLDFILTAALLSNPVVELELQAPAAPLANQGAIALLVSGNDKEEEADEPKIDPKKVEATVELLKQAFKKGSKVADKLEAITAAVDVLHEDVAKALAKGLKDKEAEVVISTIDALRQMKIPSALTELVSAHKRERNLKKDDDQFAALLKAIGSYGDHDHVELLADDMLHNPHREVIRARILSLGNTRCNESAEELISIMNSAAKKKIQPYMGEISLALTALTGADEGKSQDRWTTWWNANKRDLEIEETMPPLPKKLKAIWNKYWGIYEDEDRGEKREDRGDE